MADGSVYRVGVNVPLAAIDAVLGFTARSDARTQQQPIPAGGTVTVVRPHGPRAGTFELAFRGATAYARAAAVETSLKTGALHYFVATAAELNTWRWSATGDVEIERDHGSRGNVWILRVAWAAVA